MLISIPDVLNPAGVAEARLLMEQAEWMDGKVTAGFQSAKAKDNMQIREGDPVGQQLGANILRALGANPLFVAAALPLQIFPPLFNRYTGGQSFGTHVDNAIRQVPGSGRRVRTDISATLFLSAPEEYDGGELCVEDTYGMQKVKLPAGHMVLYPATSLHHVKPVTHGARICSFFWIQSMVRDDTRRAILFDLDLGIQKLNREIPNHPVAVQFIGIYHNLLRQWADV
jgi:PKHD-type hydroxylase